MFHDVGNAVGTAGRGAKSHTENFVLVVVANGKQFRAAFNMAVNAGEAVALLNFFFANQLKAVDEVGHGIFRGDWVRGRR